MNLPVVNLSGAVFEMLGCPFCGSTEGKKKVIDGKTIFECEKCHQTCGILTHSWTDALETLLVEEVDDD